jgi:hypothetical protein
MPSCYCLFHRRPPAVAPEDPENVWRHLLHDFEVTKITDPASVNHRGSSERMKWFFFLNVTWKKITSGLCRLTSSPMASILNRTTMSSRDQTLYVKNVISLVVSIMASHKSCWMLSLACKRRIYIDSTARLIPSQP